MLKKVVALKRNTFGQQDGPNNVISNPPSACLIQKKVYVSGICKKAVMNCYFE